MKKIVFFTMQLKTPGGIERFVSTVATMLSNDYSIEIVSNYGKPTDCLAFPLNKNIKTTFLSPTKPQEVSLKKIVTRLKWYKIPKEFIRRYNINQERNKAFKNCLESLDADYIITDRALYNSLVGKYYHGKALKIATDHNFHQNHQKYINELINSLKGFDYLVVSTKELKDFYQEKIKPTKCELIPNPLPNIPNKKTALKTKNLVSVGRLVPEKDYSLLVSAMEKVHQQDKDIKLTIIGDGVERSKLEHHIKSKNLNSCIDITGFLPQNEIAKYFYNSSLFVLTSKTEAFALVLTEAMSYGLPCIALARASGARNHITKNVGVLLNSSNPDTIASQIVYLLNNPAMLKEYQQNINKNINQYTTTEIKKTWLKILN